LLSIIQIFIYLVDNYHLMQVISKDFYLKEAKTFFNKIDIKEYNLYHFIFKNLFEIIIIFNLFILLYYNQIMGLLILIYSIVNMFYDFYKTYS